MAIREFQADLARTIVAAIGRAPSVEEIRVFAQRGLELKQYSLAAFEDVDTFSRLAAVIVYQLDNKPSRVLTELGGCKHLLDHGCSVFVQVATKKRAELRERAREIVINAISTLRLPAGDLTPSERIQHFAWFKELPDFPIPPFVMAWDISRTAADIATLIVANPPGFPANKELQIDARDARGNAVDLSPERKTLLRRAFHNCVAVHLVRMDDGLSEAPAFRGYAELTAGLLGRSPFVCFVKLGPRLSISKEYENYQSHALAYVPYHLGPRLNLQRCCLGRDDGVIVGDFVDEAESLRDCASGGRASAGLASLFNQTLRVWYANGRKDEKRAIPDHYLSDFPTEIRPSRLMMARSYGATLTLTQLRARFAQRRSMPVLTGSVHGDLHATNVLIRGSDAIIIDFEKHHHDRPLLYDLASLEGGLLVDAFGNEHRDPWEWVLSLQPLYDTPIDVATPPSCHPSSASAWFYSCVRQIRLQARQLELAPGQYATTLAYSLIRKSCNPLVFSDKKEAHRAAGYYFGELILR